jgi:MFS family permease
MPARQSYLIELVGKEDLMNAIALNSSIFNAARGIGPAVAGLLITVAGTAFCFFMNGLSYIAVIAGLLSMTVKTPARMAPPSYGVLKDMSEAIQYIRRTPILMTTISLVAVVSVFGVNFNVLVPVFTRNELHLDAAAFGFLMSSFGAGALAGSISLAVMSRLGPKPAYLLGGGMGLSLFLVVIGLQRSYGVTVFLLFLTGFCMITFFGMANTTVQLNTEDRLRGRVMSLYTMSFGGLTPFGSLFVGAVAHWLHAPLTFALGGLITGIVFFRAIVKRKMAVSRQHD